jgi:hypothetical protein
VLLIKASTDHTPLRSATTPLHSAPLQLRYTPLHYMSFTTIKYPNTSDARRTVDWLLAQHARRSTYDLSSSCPIQFVESDDPSCTTERLNALALDAMLDGTNPNFLDAPEAQHTTMPSAQPFAMPSAPHKPQLNSNVQPSSATLVATSATIPNDSDHICSHSDACGDPAETSTRLSGDIHQSLPISKANPAPTFEPAANAALQSTPYPTHDNTCSSSVLCYRPVSTIYRPTPTTKAVLPDSPVTSAHSREFSRNQWFAFSRGLHKIDVGNRLDTLPPARTTDLSNLTPSKPNLYNIPISQSIFAEPSSFENREFQLCSAISAVQASLSTESAHGIPCRSFIFVPGNENQFACLKSDHAPQSLFNIRCDYVSKIEPEPPPRFTFKYPLLFSVFQMSFRLLYAYGGSNSMGQYQFLDMYRVTSSS